MSDAAACADAERDALEAWADDAVRDALALLRAHLAHDAEATAAVTVHMTAPQLTATALARFMAALMGAFGLGNDDVDKLARHLGVPYC